MKIAFNPSTVAALTAPPNNKDITFDLRGRNIFARGVKFYGTDTNTWRDIKINNVSIGSHTLDLRNGSNTTLTNTNGIVTINSTWRPVVDNLTSDSTTSSLSAKQGKVLKALIDGKSNSDHNHDGRYVRKSGDTMSGVLIIDTTNFGALAIKRSDDVNGASIQFRGKSNIYGYIGFNAANRNKQLLRWNGTGSQVYTILDTSSTYISGGKGVINGTTITQVDNADKLDGYHANTSQSPFGRVPTIGGDGVMEIGKYIDFHYDNEGKYDYSTRLQATGNHQNTLLLPSGTGTLALTSQIPNKNSWNYDDRYLKLTGGAMVGTINRRSGGSTISGRDHAIIRQTHAPGGSSWNPIACVDTETGTWTLGHLSSGSSNTDFSFCFSTNADYNAGNNNGNYVTLRNRVGTIALTSEIPSKGSWNYDDRYYTKAESNAKYITDITTSVNKLTFTKNGSSIARTITVNNVQSLGRRSPLTERNAISGIYTYGTYSATDNLAPTNYFETLGFGEGVAGTIEIGGSWISGGKLYWRALRDYQENWFSWKTILDSSNYSSILDSRYYTESEVNSLLSKKLDRVNLSVGSWNPRGYHLAADYYYNGGDLSISENGGKMYVSIDGQFYQNGGQYRVLDTSDIGSIRGSLTLNQYLSSTDTSWYPLVWGGDTHKNTNNSTGSLYKSYDKLSWQTSSQTLYATKLRTTNLDTQTAFFHPGNDSTLKIYSGRTQDSVSDGHIGLQTSIDNTDGQTHAYPTQYGSRCVLALQPRGGSVYIGNMPNGGNGRKLNVNGDIGLFNTGSIRDLAIGGGIYWNPCVESATDGSDAASITLVKSGVAGGTTLVLSQMNDANDTIQFKTSTAAKLYHNSYPILTTQNTYVNNRKGYIYGTEITQVNNSDTVDGYHENSFLRYRGATNKDQEATLWSQIGIKEYQKALPDSLTGVYNFGSVISLPGLYSRFEIYASHQSSTGNGLYYRSGWVNDKQPWRKFIDSSNIGSQSVNYANSAGSASSADKTRALKYTGTGSSEITAHQTDASYMGRSGWASYIICNYGNGSTYYSQTIAMPFWGSPIYRRLEGGTDKGWKKFYTEEAPPSWNNITNKPSTFTPAAHTHTWASITDKIVAGNEFNIVNAGFKGSIWFNYLPINDRSKTATILRYHFGNGAKGYASVAASGFAKIGSNNSYVLLGDGGHKTISSLSVNYANSAGSATKASYVTLTYCRDDSSPSNKGLWNTIKNGTSSAQTNKVNFYTIYNSAGGPSGHGEMMEILSYNANHWQPQLWFGAGKTGGIYYRNKSYNDNTWGSWQTVAFTSQLKDPVNYYWANVKISASSSTGTSPTFSAAYTSNWFRSSGSTGWYSQTYGGGIYMTDATWIRAYGNKGIVAKNFYASNWASATYLLRSDGGAAAFNWSGQSGQPTWLWGGNSQHSYYVYNPSNFSVKYAASAGAVAWGNVTGRPSSLKNPYSLNVFGVAYDGSVAKTVTTSTFISQVNEATSTITDGTMLITSYASNSGFADTNAVNVPYKRKAVHLWDYIDGKVSTKYLPLAGGTMNANARISHGNGNLYIGRADNNGWVYTQDIASHAGTDKWSIKTSGAARFGSIYIASKSDGSFNSNVIECGSSIHLNHFSSQNVSLCNGGGTVQIGPYTTGDTGNNKLYVNGSEFINGSSNVRQHVYADGFRHRGHNSNDAVLLAGGGYSQGVPVKYWSIVNINIQSDRYAEGIKMGGNYTFLTNVKPYKNGSCVLTLQFPSGYNYNNTMVWAMGRYNKDSASDGCIYATIMVISVTNTEAKCYLNLADDATLNNGACQLYFMCF